VLLLAIIVFWDAFLPVRAGTSGLAMGSRRPELHLAVRSRLREGCERLPELEGCERLSDLEALLAP